ncbi:MAG: TonB family protein [Bacteroidia bacterium]|nr:TonB family protein [Bacteroidia bacterium]
MNPILNYMAESLIVGLAFYLLFRSVLSKVNDYNFQRIVVLVSVMAIALFPLVRITIYNPVISGYFILDPAYALSGVAKELKPREEYGSISVIPLLVFSLVTMVLLLINARRFYKLYKLKKSSESKEKHPGYYLYRGKNISSPFSFGKSIYVPVHCVEEELEMVLVHEKSHIIHNHSRDIVLFNMVNVFQWFNPFIRLFGRDLVSIHEYQADSDVLKTGADISRYRELLFFYQFDVAPVLSNSLQKSLTHKRFIKMENLIQKKAGVKVVVLFSAAAMFLFSVTSFSKGSVAKENNDLVQTPSQAPLRTTAMDTTSKKVPFTAVEVKPKFMGGDENTFVKWIAERLVYPEKAKNDKLMGRVILQFTVKKSGKVSDIKVVRGISPELDNEAVRVVSLSPDWEPGKMKGINVDVVYTFPVIFHLGDKKKSE